MYQYNVEAPFERIAADVVGTFPLSDQGNRYEYLVMAMDYFTKWPDAYAVPNQEASLVTIFFCHFGVPGGLQNDQGRNFEYRLMQVLQRLGAGKTPTTPLHPRSDGMVERYIKTVEVHLPSRTRVEAGSNTSTVTLRVVGGD
jgi:hypothetical protein